MISARKAKQLDATTMFTYSHANTPLGQSERAYYLSYFINVGEDGLNRSTRIKRKLTFLQVSCDHEKTKTVPCICGELFLALPLSGSSLVIRISVRP